VLLDEVPTETAKYTFRTIFYLPQIISGVIVVFSIIAFDRIRIDDPVGAISVHGVCGIFGLLVVPLSNPDASLLSQLAGIGAIGGFVFVFSLAVWALLRMTMGIRVNPDDERAGLDYVELPRIWDVDRPADLARYLNWKRARGC